jgi:ATP-dependent Clp protease ATP-binding subunit ClpC
MATYRFPVLVWQDHEGYHTAALVEWSEPAGFGRSAADALDPLRDYLEWRYREEPWRSEPDFLDPVLVEFKVPVRPEYHVGDRVYPSAEPLTLRVPGVHGRQESGLLLCSLPTLDIRFYYYEAAARTGLATHYVQQRLKGLTPQQLSRCLPPRRTVLEEIVLLVAGKKRKQQYEPNVETLAVVAESLGERRLRRQFARAWERDREVAEVVQKLGKDRANVLLVGEPGSGKTTVLVEAIHKVDRQPEEGAAGESIRPGKRFWLTSGARLIAGMKYLGQWEQRCEEVIEELSNIGGVLCVDNLLDLVRTGSRSPSNSVAAFFLPYLQRGELRLAAEATPAELDACRRLLPGFADVFQVVNLTPFGRREAVAVLDRLATALRQDLHLEMSRGVVDLVYHLFRRFVPYHAFPGKATGFLAELFEGVRRERGGEVTTQHIVELFVRQTGLPELFLRDEVPLGRCEVVETFRAQVMGQDEAVQTAANLVTTFKAGLNDPNRPVGVLLFCGPTGVGKTELAKALARFFFGHGEQAERLVRLDMSEYAGLGAAERLLTGPDGEPSELIKKLRQQPFTVLLLDEVEKADPEVFDVLLNVFDEGRLTDRYGRLTTFRSAVIVMTSNLGAGKQEPFGFGRELAVRYDAEALKFFRPEFFNRIDAVVTFQPLQRETILRITRKELTDLGKREGLTKAGLRLTWSERLVEHLAKEGFDARYGARPLQRTLESLVVTPLARFLLKQPELRDTEVRADLDSANRICFARLPGEMGRLAAR